MTKIRVGLYFYAGVCFVVRAPISLSLSLSLFLSLSFTLTLFLSLDDDRNIRWHPVAK